MPGLPAAAVHRASDICETVTRSAGQGFLGSLVGGMADELRDGLTLNGGRPLNLCVKLWIEPQASHATIVSRYAQIVLQPLSQMPVTS
jgi:hypothetical protein